jgi:hypothetical protein
MDDKLTIFIAITAAAVFLQMLILLGIGIVMYKLGARLKAVVDEAESRVLPLLDNAKGVLQDVKTLLESSRPKVDLVLDNAAHVTTTVRTDADRLQTTFNDLLDRVHLQAIRADEMVTRTMDTMEETSEKVQHSVMSPIRKVSGMAQAVSVGVGTYFNNQRRRRNGGQSDEMFI